MATEEASQGLHVSLVAADRQVWEGAAKMVVAATAEGEIGILRGHEPVLAVLADGVVRIETHDARKLVVAVHGGFFSVDSDEVAILAESAELAEDIDVARAKAALERGKESQDEESAAAVRRAETRLRAASMN